MSKKLIIPLLLAVAPIFFSCGPSKKMKAAQSQIEDLTAKNTQLQKQVTDLQVQVGTLTNQNTSVTNAYASYRTQCEQDRQKLQRVSAALREQYDRMQAIKDKINAALADMQSKGVEVYYDKGYVFVSLASDLLFKSGSAKLDSNGKKALASVADVLNSYPNMKLVVLGNTDSVQYKKGGTGNWNLSTERAVNVVKIFRDDYQVDPARMTAAGKGKYAPVADNGTPEGRAKNRRIDLILNPETWTNFGTVLINKAAGFFPPYPAVIEPCLFTEPA